MKKVSLKVKLTFLYTVLMSAVVFGILAILFSISSQELLGNVQNQLEKQVMDARENIRFDGEKLRFDSDLLELEHGIYLSVYASDGTLLYGKIPYGFDNQIPFEDGSVRRYQGVSAEYYVMDLVYRVSDYGVVDIRGVVSVTAAEANFRSTVHLAVIFLPLLVLLSAALGYYMTGKTLRPVKTMTETVQKICRDGDLSQRILLGEGKDEIYHLAATFDELLDQVEKSLSREQQFTSDVSHELRTPLSAMVLQCEELLEKDHLDDEVREGVLLLEQKVKYLTGMISQLLILSRADQGREKVEQERINFSELTEMAVEEIREKADEKGITLETNITEGMYLTGDETLLIRFWMNLLNNAVTYGKEGGHICVSLQSWGDRMNGEVRDDGIGISEEDLPKIWDRFYQADPSRSQNDGQGLGLSMVKWIVKVHKGEIRVVSHLGEGTCFYFSFPKE
ncbi:MAG: sensor histidine kinase [Fusicatenibacter sp.]|nr:HAMP domain-containing histidine kinase [Fusicatenibacter sp.]